MSRKVLVNRLISLNRFVSRDRKLSLPTFSPAGEEVTKQGHFARSGCHRCGLGAGLLAISVLCSFQHARAAIITWIGGNVDWVDATGAANWNPADEPDSNDDVIFSTANTVNLGSSNFILSLALSGGISLNTNNFDLTVDGLLQLTGAGTDLTIGGSASSVSADFVTINTDGRIYLDGGALRIADETAAGLLDIKAGGILSGQGTIYLDDALAVATTLMDNEGTLSASALGVAIGMPAAGMLVIPPANSFARIDLDGTSGGGIVSVGRNQLLDINVPLTDSFGGDLNLSHASTINLSPAWTMNAGTLDADNGAVAAPFPIAANTSYIAGAAFTQTGGIITVVDTDGTLQFNAPFTQTGGNLVNNGKVVFNAAATIGAGANFTMPTDYSSLTVAAGVTVAVNQANFNADGNGTAANAITVNSAGTLDLNLGAGADEALNGPVILNGGTLDVTTLSNTWSINSALAIGASTGFSELNGEAVTIYGAVTVGGSSQLGVSTNSVWENAASLAIASGGWVDFGAGNTLSGITSITGAGTLRVLAPTTVTENSTIAVNTFDWDGTASGTVHTINDGVTLTINSPNIDTDGKINDSITLGASGSTLTVNGPASWEMQGTLSTNSANVGTAALAGTSRMVLATANGLFNVNGNTIANAPITFNPSSVTTVAAGATLDLNAVPTFSGGAITGAGRLRVGGSSVVTANTAISAGTLDWDRSAFGHTHTINEGVSLTITSPVLEDGAMSDSVTLRGNGTTLTMSGPASWEMRGTLTTNPLALGTATVGGTSRMVLTSASGILNANGNTTVSAPITLGPSSATNVAASALLTLGANSTIFNGGTVAGAGTLRVGSTSTASANTTISVNTFDWDGTGSGSLHSISDGVTFTINSPVFDDDGAMNDPLSLGGSGATLTVNGPVSWEMRRALTTNTPAVGTATIGGTSRLVLTSADASFIANGNTTISAPITFGTASVTTVAASAMLTVNGDATYDGGTITGAGYYAPPTSNTVVASSTISTTNFNFDRGNWTLNPGGNLTVAVTDYDLDAISHAFDFSITITDATLKVTSADPTFIVDGVMNCHSTITHAAWGAGSDPLDIGNDSGSLDATLNITGTGHTQIATDIDFKSDANVDIATGATLQLLGTATFDSVNGANNAEFTGAGRLQANREVYFNEATTFNMTGGSIDLDGADAIGDTIYVKAPVVIKVATMDSFGNSNFSGTNVLDVNHSTGTGTLTVNLDSPTAEWTLNGPGSLLLTNDPAAAAVTLLAGSDVNLNGIVNVTGDVRTDARVDVGGSVNIQTVGKPFRLSGGDLTATNTLVGGVFNGPGLLGADSASSLIGHGTINANVDFDGNADLFADNGTLTVNSSIIDARFVGTNDTDGVLNVVNAWNSNTVTGVYLKGGELKGGILTNDGTGGITGSGLVSSRVINNNTITATNSAAPLILQTVGNDNDWDGNLTPETGRLQANAGTLELRSSGGGFSFNSTVTAVNGGTVFANGFDLEMAVGSTLNLTSGTFKQSNGITTNLYGTITVGAGTSQLLGAATGGFRFNGTSATTLTGNLLLDCPTTTIQTGAAFAGAGRLVNLPGRRLAPDNLASVNALVENRGTLTPGTTSAARNDVLDYMQTAAGTLAMDLNGTTLGNFDRLLVNGSAQLAGNLTLTLGGGYVPALGNTFTIVSATGGVTGAFAPLVQPVGMPSGTAFTVTYTPTTVVLSVVTPFEAWINSFTALTNPADKTKSADPDHDTMNNLGEFGLDGDPTSGANTGKVVGKIASVGGSKALTLTLPVRTGAILDPTDPVGGELVLKQSADGLKYRIQASDELSAWTLTVTEVTGADAAVIQRGLPALHSGWGYRTFRSPGPVAGDPIEFMRAVISE
ncbi:MAG: hypothetical protein NTW21_34055 [Verrucomicrobia bacterium]|nr:hypothetical protein [Verrucomicrobiota bacterium]